MQPQSIKQTANVQLHNNSPTPTHTPAHHHLRMQEEGRWKIHLRMFKTHPCSALEEGRPTGQHTKYPYTSTSEHQSKNKLKGNFFFISYV